MITIFHQLDARLDGAFSFRKTKSVLRSHHLVVRMAARVSARDAVEADASGETVIIEDREIEEFDFEDTELAVVEGDSVEDEDVAVVEGDSVEDEDVAVVEGDSVEGEIVEIGNAEIELHEVEDLELTVVEADNDEAEDIEGESGELEAAESESVELEAVEDDRCEVGDEVSVDFENDDVVGFEAEDAKPTLTNDEFEQAVNELASAKFTSFVNKAVDRAALAAGSWIEKDDLSQVAQLAAIEAGRDLDDVAPNQRSRFLRKRVTAALKQELKSVAVTSRSRTAVLTTSTNEDEIGELISLDRLTGPSNDEANELLASAETSSEVRGILQKMPDEIVKVVRLRFGLDSGNELQPDDIADILDMDPKQVADHLWAARTLFRHSSSDGEHRDRSPIGVREFQTFKWEGDLASYDLRQLNLNNANFEHCNLSDAVLSGMNLWGAKFFRATLHRTSMWGAQVDGSDLQQADLAHSNFERASLCGANLRLANASEANFWGADFSGAQLDHANFHQADLRSANLAGLNLSDTNFTGADLSGADLRGCVMEGTYLLGANLRGADLTNASLQFADLRNADLCWANMSGADLYGASMQGAIQSPALRHMFASKAPRPRRLRSVAG